MIINELIQTLELHLKNNIIGEVVALDRSMHPIVFYLAGLIANREREAMTRLAVRLALANHVRSGGVRVALEQRLGLLPLNVAKVPRLVLEVRLPYHMRRVYYAAQRPVELRCTATAVGALENVRSPLRIVKSVFFVHYENVAFLYAQLFR